MTAVGSYRGRPRYTRGDQLTRLVRGKLWLQVLIGMVLGLLTGVLLGPTVGWVDPHTATIVGSWLAVPGQLLLALIQMIVIPLINERPGWRGTTSSRSGHFAD